ncbi:MAG TPA: hypothetical protein VFK80_10085 [Limnochordia bacterium]|nr:hypothetical protein [Limnochordia bacterium]
MGLTTGLARFGALSAEQVARAVAWGLTVGGAAFLALEFFAIPYAVYAGAVCAA